MTTSPNNRLNKHQIVKKVCCRLDHQIHHLHVANIISLFIDEFATELKHNKKLKIKNFYSVRLEHSKPRKFYNFTKQRIAISQGKWKIKIKLMPKLRRKIANNLDIVKLFF